MTEGMRWIGGARVGWVNATWPFGILSASREKIVLNATVIGKYEFSPNEVIAIQQYGSIPILGCGVQIVHNKKDYPKKLIFWCFGSPTALIEDIKRGGFVPQGGVLPEATEADFPIRWQAVLFFFVYWNAFFLIDMFHGGQFHGKPGPLSLIPLLTVFLVSLLIWRIKFLQQAVMSPGHTPREISSFLYLLTLITGVMSVFLAIESIAKLQ